MADPLLARLRDRLPVNPPYTGLVAEAYDAWIGVDDVFPDDAVHEAVVAGADGPVLELGCGTGRPLLRWLAAGHDVEGIDASPDMLVILRRHAAERGLDPVVHLGDIAPLHLGRRYAALVCPAGTFTLVDDDDRARAALASYADHLRPGGVLALTLDRTEVPGHDALRWRLRRTGTLADGRHVVVHEALLVDAGGCHEEVYDRLEAYDPDGRLGGTWLRRHRRRRWERAEIAGVLGEVGFGSVRSVGDDVGWVTVATRR